MELEGDRSKAYRFPRTRKTKLDENWLYFGGGLFALSQAGEHGVNLQVYLMLPELFVMFFGMKMLGQPK